MASAATVAAIRLMMRVFVLHALLLFGCPAKGLASGG